MSQAVPETVYIAENQVLRMNIEILAVPETVWMSACYSNWHIVAKVDSSE